MKIDTRIHFEVSERKILLRLFDTVFVILALFLLDSFVDFQYIDVSLDNLWWIVILGLYVNVIGTIFEMYNLQVASNQFQVVRSILLTASTTVLFYLLTPFLTPFLPSNRLQIIYFFGAIFIGLLIWRIFYQAFLASHRFEKKAVLICDKEEIVELVGDLQAADPHYRVIGYIDTGKSESYVFNYGGVDAVQTENLVQFIQEQTVSELVIAGAKADIITVPLYNELLRLLEFGFPIKEYTQVYETLTQRIPIHYLDRDFYRYFPFSRSNQNKLYLIFVRAVEIILAIVGLLAGCVILPLILLGNLLGNRGPLFYKQIRVGKFGKPFKIYKFRTMVKNAEAGSAVFATSNDVRVTTFGKFLRKTRLDEIPQFINILIGNMGFIGPRPERPEFVQELSEIMPFYETRHIIKPGLTGWAQVNYSYGQSFEDSLIKLQYDLYYIKHRSIFLDLNIVIKTFSTILFYRGQ
ncbi:exopolysaccharide biosynthesis polyprenyl glycosylphosphotransferase [Flavobacterium sp.]|uniref:exopolysaccharide biosynthesis polyprenyl glycosylphosphotransferase n=1 Tax=Flavobacterium sp. TaxID=239 RepID=UPI0026183528|nr:exopolysaccharide biosynthesis polyprenyl glycosylphosphotransferase [Flavobacterium sp.]